MELFRRGYHTIEATFLMLIITTVIVMLCFLSLYIHDKTVLDAEIRYQLAVATEQSESNERMKNRLIKNLENHLFLIKLNEVKISQGLTEFKATVKYSNNIKLFGINTINESKQTHYDMKPAHLMWDLEMIKE